MLYGAPGLHQSQRHSGNGPRATDMRPLNLVGLLHGSRVSKQGHHLVALSSGILKHSRRNCEAYHGHHCLRLIKSLNGPMASSMCGASAQQLEEQPGSAKRRAQLGKAINTMFVRFPTARVCSPCGRTSDQATSKPSWQKGCRYDAPVRLDIDTSFCSATPISCSGPRTRQTRGTWCCRQVGLYERHRRIMLPRHRLEEPEAGEAFSLCFTIYGFRRSLLGSGHGRPILIRVVIYPAREACTPTSRMSFDTLRIPYKAESRAPPRV